MGYKTSKLWEVMVEKAKEEDKKRESDRQIQHEYIIAVEKLCQYGIDRSKRIFDTFPTFTLHDEVHIGNVLRLMADLLGNEINRLSRDEAAMLIISACCHDIGMSCSEEEKKRLLNSDKVEQYLKDHPAEYVKAYKAGEDNPVMTDDMIQNYLRSIHHERIAELLYEVEWPEILNGKVNRGDVIRVCQSHGESISGLVDLQSTSTIDDLRFCAILLRLADILDFDNSRAPETIYKYLNLQKADSESKRKSKAEYEKHEASQGVDFEHVKCRTRGYAIPYHATCNSLQKEQAINLYLEWVDRELLNCTTELSRYHGKWQRFVLPGKIQKNIISEGYVSGQFRFTLDQDKILELFTGENLYGDPFVFVRELLQNAIDAVRTREQLDKKRSPLWKGQINIRCWIDEEGYQWFRIEDNGVGMTEDIIRNHFLKTGNSYYSSDTFNMEKLMYYADPDYTPISRFGIGILSCFMGDKENSQVEVSTKHFPCDGNYCPGLRLSMHGINGYYYLANSFKHFHPEAMPGPNDEEKRDYREKPGTVVAVRTNLYQTARYKGFKEIVDKYVVFPPVAIHYEGWDGCCDYMTEEEFIKGINSIQPSENLEKKGILEIPIPEKKLSELYERIPELHFNTPPILQVKCISLNDYMCSSAQKYMEGVVLGIRVIAEYISPVIKFWDRDEKMLVSLTPSLYSDGELGIEVSLSPEQAKDDRDAMLHSEGPWVCSSGSRLSDIGRHNKYFKKLIDTAGTDSTIAYNGILCGRSSILSQSFQSLYTLPMVVLLKDKYRPYVDVSRDKISGYPFEMACEIDLIGYRLEKTGFSLERDKITSVEGKDISYITMKWYCDLLNRRKDMISYLEIRTDKGFVKLSELDKELKDNSTLRCYIPTLCHELYVIFMEGPRFSITDYLCSAWLRENYSVEVEFVKDNTMEAYVSKRKKDVPEDYKEAFPANFFLPERNGNDTILTVSSADKRIACNENHRLSRFLMDNSVEMRKRVPGIFEQMLYTLAESKGQVLINDVNKQLERLRNYPGGVFSVTENLTYEDLIGKEDNSVDSIVCESI